MTELEFKAGIAFLSNLFGQIKDEVIPVYWNFFKSYSAEDFKKMIEQIIQNFIPTSQVPFPLPAHFLNYSGLSGKNRTILAINAVKSAICSIGPYRTVNFGDRALHETIDRFGGWPEMCTWNLEKWQYNEKRFIECYESSRAAGTGREKCIGLCEIDNSNKIHLFNKKQKAFALEQEKQVFISWKGFTKLLPYESKEKYRIENKEVNDILSGIKIKSISETNP